MARPMARLAGPTAWEATSTSSLAGSSWAEGCCTPTRRASPPSASASIATPKGVIEVLEGARFRSVFGSVSGDALKRNPRGYAPDHPAGHLLRLEDVIFGRRMSDEEVFSAELPDIIANDLDAARPVFGFLAELTPSSAAAE